MATAMSRESGGVGCAAAESIAKADKTKTKSRAITTEATGEHRGKSIAKAKATLRPSSVASVPQWFIGPRSGDPEAFRFPVARVPGPNTPIPFSPPLEAFATPWAADVVDAVRRARAGRGPGAVLPDRNRVHRETRHDQVAGNDVANVLKGMGGDDVLTIDGAPSPAGPPSVRAGGRRRACARTPRR